MKMPLYVGKKALDYELDREKGRRWQNESRFVETELESVPAGARVLDIPVGTGRFLPFYSQRKFLVTGIDVSDDMLAQATLKQTNAVLQLGDIFNPDDRPDGQFDAVVCIRFLDWFWTDREQDTPWTDYLSQGLSILSSMTVKGGLIIATIKMTEDDEGHAGVEPESIFERFKRESNLTTVKREVVSHPKTHQSLIFSMRKV